MSKSCSQMASSSSRRGKKAAHRLKNASPNGWISDDEERYKFGCYRKLFKDVDETPSTFTPQTKFERFVVYQFRMLSTRISKVEKSLIMIHKKSDEDNALITPSTSESDDEDDTTEVESMETSDSD
ncbi:uncharacterized protein HKW66_Vig0180860 [Vigna angularis]|uniref:Uncharacterized protein n=1 Tax=Phaseolus angularis TaxID=3914 RepID=A0A8T0K4P1_PHAAN|nr:uncharacterized protein HKW66_Vig0180860 [Vigna angularis]